MKEFPQDIVHDENDREMMLRVAELARKPPSLERYKEICDAAYKGIRHALINFHPFYVRRSWVKGIVHLLSVQPMDKESADLGLGFSIDDAKFIEKCLKTLVPLIETHSRKADAYTIVPSGIVAMHSRIDSELKQCRDDGLRFSLFNALFKESELVAATYKFTPLYVPLKKEPPPILESSIDDIDNYLSQEDTTISSYISAWHRDMERYRATQKKLDDYNAKLCLEQVSFDDMHKFIESYSGDAPRKPTAKIIRDLSSILKFKGCGSYDSETSPHHFEICQTNYYNRYSLDEKRIGFEVDPIHDAVSCFIRDQIVAAESVSEADRLNAISERFSSYIYDSCPDDVIKAIIGEFERVYKLKHKAVADMPESGGKAQAPTRLSDRERKLCDWRTIRKICEKEHTAAGTTDGTGITEAARRAEQRGLLKYYKNARSAASAYSQAMSRYTVTNWNSITLPEGDE